MSELSDEALLAGMAVGDEKAAVTFVRRYQRRVYGLAMSMLGDAQAAEDVAQEALLRAWRHAQVFDARRGSAATWLLAITRNLAIDAMRVRRSSPMDPARFLALGSVSLDESPEDLAEAMGERPDIKTALTELPPEQRRALVLAVVYGLTALDVAEREAIPLGTAKSRIRAALMKVRQSLGREGAGVMTGSVRDPQCVAVQDDLVELALGTLSGLDRSTALSHVHTCADCRAEVELLSSAADAVVLLAPEMEPTAGFETRLFERMGVRPKRRFAFLAMRKRVALAGSAALATLGLGLGIGLSIGIGGATVATSPIGADLTADHVTRGEVYVAPGNPGWLFMSVDHVGESGLVTCRLRTVHGRTTTVGTFWIEGGSGAWVSRLPVPADQVASTWLVGSGGTVLASASFNH